MSFTVSWVLPFMLASSTSVYKCNDNGTVVYSQFPCGKDQQVVTIKAPPFLGGQTAQQQTAQQTQQQTAQQVLADIESYVAVEQVKREIARLEGKREAKLKQRDAQLLALQQKKLKANNNLAGAQWETSISEEMSAISQAYATEVESLDAAIRSLQQRQLQLEHP
ncbi:DUF4124 domain-containing protein [Pseudoalteromonas fenneropenaei]|uniref:DUF4124 domain-containing protein n=1 Tax=Pseudoalteromonas fenneropenaei TaxID=1737459 RepID=A0ABV7CLF8_9GAMM